MLRKEPSATVHACNSWTISNTPACLNIVKPTKQLTLLHTCLVHSHCWARICFAVLSDLHPAFFLYPQLQTLGFGSRIGCFPHSWTLLVAVLGRNHQFVGSSSLGSPSKRPTSPSASRNPPALPGLPLEPPTDIFSFAQLLHSPSSSHFRLGLILLQPTRSPFKMASSFASKRLAKELSKVRCLTPTSLPQPVCPAVDPFAPCRIARARLRNLPNSHSSTLACPRVSSSFRPTISKNGSWTSKSWTTTRCIKTRFTG